MVIGLSQVREEADQGDDLSRANRKRKSSRRLDLAVTNVEFIGRERGHEEVPTSASIILGPVRTAFGEPCASSQPW